jgi:predicted transcriptional regulator
MQERERLHALVDTLAEDELQAALRFLEHLGTEDVAPLWSLSDAPADDEPLTSDDEAALAEAERDVAEGRIVPHDEARRRLLGDA